VLFETSDLIVLNVKLQLQSLLVLLKLFNLLDDILVYVHILALLVALVSVHANLRVFASDFNLEGLIALVKTNYFLLHLLLLTLEPLVCLAHLFQVRGG